VPFAAATAQTYSVVDVAAVSGFSPGINLTAINADGLMSGYTTSAFVSDGVTITNLPLLGPRSEGYGINASGQVTGASDVSSGPGPHAFLFSGGSMMDLGTSPGGNSSTGRAINDSGQITGDSTVDGGLFDHAFLYSNGTMTDLGTLPGGTQSQGNAINDSGVVVGQADTAKSDTHAFVTQGNSLTDLGTLAGGTTGVGYTSKAFAINNAGQIVGTSSVLPSGMHAFLYSGGKMTDLGTLGGNSSANGVNSSGQVVGSSDNCCAFLYANGVMTNLNSLIDPSDPMFGKVSLGAGVGINDSGWIITFGAEDLSNPVAPTFTAFLLVPLRFSPRSLTFSNNQPVGTQSAPQPITLTNLATSPLTISQITPTSGFTQTNDCPASLANGSSCTIKVSFSPSMAGSQSGILNVTTASTTFTLPVPLSGSAPASSGGDGGGGGGGGGYGGGGGGGSFESLTLAALLSSLLTKLLSARQHYRRFS
jgi:probable HAF family extracellular repeat protein